jgi:tRNA(Arg) A34 adenosine deaminase TadA
MRLLDVAAKYALSGDKRKDYLIAALVERSDGAITISRNSLSREREPNSHAEFKALRKADSGCILYVARVLRSNGQWAMCKPCKRCQAIIKSRRVYKVYYTIGPNEYGVWYVNKTKEP